MTARRWLMLIGLLLVLAVVNLGIYNKEHIKRHGEVIFLELAPVDPRSLLQGDYMALNFSLAREILQAQGGLATNQGRALSAADTNRLAGHNLDHERVGIKLDARRVATLAKGEKPADATLKFRWRNGRVWLGTNAFFFEEGTAQQYAKAKYGEFQLDRTTGEAVLVGLRDEMLAPL